MNPSSRLLDSLKRDRVRLHGARPSTGFGERRSTQKGVGLEFAESRPFREGDDFKNLDPRISMRTGESYIREYFFERRAAVQIVVDTSASMAWPDGSKFELAGLMANLLGFVALISGDDVRIVSPRAGRVHHSPWFHGERRSAALFDHVASLTPDAGIGFAAALDAVSPSLKPKALVVLVSDFLDEGLPGRMAALSARGADLVAVDLTHRDEREPLMHPGAYSLYAAEDTAGLDLTIDNGLKAAYREEFALWKQTVKDIVEHRGGLHMTIDAPERDPDAVGRILRQRLLPVRS